MKRPELTNLSTKVRRLLAGALALCCGLALAQPVGFQASGPVIGDDVMYSIGGGSAVSMGRAAGMRSIGVGVGWNSNLICGDMSIQTTLRNQLNGITNGFQQIMGNVIQSATSAVASLPALIIQRADPGLYNLLTNGVLQARLDFDRSKLTCRAMAEKMADTAGGQLGWSQMAEGMALRDAVASTDAVSAIEQAETRRGNDGVPWVGGSNAGGAGQPAVRVVGDVTRAGYNLVNGRGVTDTSSISAASCASLSCQTWTSPQQAIEWATRVLGEQEQRTCDACTKTVTTPGVGLTPLIQEENESKLEVLQELVAGSRPTGFDNLQAAGSASLPVTRGVIEALRDEPDQDLLARRLASEVALASVLEKALLLQRTCDSCTKTETVPGVGLTPLIQEEYEAKLETLQALISGTRNTTFENLRTAGSSSLPITRGVIEALRDEPDQDLLARRLASEVALSSVLEKALLLQRTLLTGKKEPNVAANQLAVEAVNHESNTLDQEVRNLKTELELRRELANNSPMAIIQRHGTRAAGSRGIYEGDPVPDRLDQLQRGNPGGRP